MRLFCVAAANRISMMTMPLYGLAEFCILYKPPPLLKSTIMKSFLLLPFVFLASFTYAQTKLSVADWQSDLRFLQQTIHKDYSFLFQKITATEFDAAADSLYNAMPGMQEHERIAGLVRMVSLLKYGHTALRWRESQVIYHIAPINFYWFSDGIYVEGVSRNYSSILGAKLVSVEGVPVMQALEAVKPLVPAENDQFFKAYGLDYLLNPEALHAQRVTKELKKTVTYTFEKDGKSFEQTVGTLDTLQLPRTYGFVSRKADWLSVRDTGSTPYYLKNLDRIYYYEYLPASKTVYIRHSQIQDDPQEKIPLFYKKVFEFIDTHDVERLVLDVRLNGGGNNTKNKPIITGIIESKKINKPGKLFVIIGRRTFSACQNLVNELSNYTNALFVGEPTAENINFYGDNRRVELPRTKTPVYLSFAWWQDKAPWDNGPWLAPQLAADMSFDDYRSNRDPALEACLQFSDDSVIIDPMTYLRELFSAGKMEQLAADAKKMANDKRYRYLDLESQFNKAGYQLINSGQVPSAIWVFRLNTEIYPGSANAWNGLAEAYQQAAQTDNAIKCYNKAIGLDPGGAAGKRAKKMVQQLKADQKGN
jgi:tetratricopeptide (TPR) repeat protein